MKSGRWWVRLPGVPGQIFRSGWQWLQSVRRRINAWRQIRFTRAGLVFTLGSFAVGFAAFNTGNNLLYLLFGSMLGLIVVSGWLSEQVIRHLAVHRRVPRGVTAGNPARIRYEVTNLRGRVPSFALEVGEATLPGRGFLPLIPAGEKAATRPEIRLTHRGVFPLEAVHVSTTFPFGLFKKSRDIPLKGELVVWPRSDRRLRPPSPSGGRSHRSGTVPMPGHGVRGEYRGLRNYRPGDDPRDIHWRTTARLGHPVVREYDESNAETLWICLDHRGRPGQRAEAAVEMAASLAARAFRQGRRFGFAYSGGMIEAGLGPGQLERILGALARIQFSTDSGPLTPPADPRHCVLVSLRPGAGPQFGDVYTPPSDGSP
jgi:uncharacterized protein (DUF58 family)